MHTQGFGDQRDEAVWKLLAAKPVAIVDAFGIMDDIVVMEIAECLPCVRSLRRNRCSFRSLSNIGDLRRPPPPQ